MQNLSTEGLARITEDGRAEPRLAEGWTIAPDGLSMDIRLRPGITFHDGSPVTADAVVEDPQQRASCSSWALHSRMSITSRQSPTIGIEIGFNRASPFLQEALDLQIRKPDSSIYRHWPISNRRTQFDQTSFAQILTTTWGVPRSITSSSRTIPASGRHGQTCFGTESTCCTKSAQMRWIR